MKIGYDPEVRYRHLEIDARARIAWGHDKRRVEAFLRANQVPSGRIHKIVDEASAERDRAFRRRAQCDLGLAAILGGIVLIPTGALSVGLEEGLRAAVGVLGPGHYLILLVAAWLTAQGTTRLAFGSAGEGSPNHARDPLNAIIWDRLLTYAVILVVVIVGITLAHLLR